MKIVINGCFGGFSLSPLAVKRLAEIEGRECYFFKYDSKDLDRYIPTAIDEIDNSLFWVAFDIPNPNEIIPSSKKWHTLTDKERDHHNEIYRQHHLDSRDSNRTDPNLIRVVEELGEKADGACASLKIVEIPDGVEWEIDEYDGRETIDEKHRGWW